MTDRDILTGFDGDGRVLWRRQVTAALGAGAVPDDDLARAHRIVTGDGRVLKDRSGPAPRDAR